MAPKTDAAPPPVPEPPTQGRLASTQTLAEKDVVINTLQEAAKRHSETEAALSAQNEELSRQLKACQRDLHDINEFLLNELKAQALVCAELEDKLSDADKRLEETSTSFRAEAEAAAQAHEDSLVALQQQLDHLLAKSAEATAYLKEKGSLLGQLKDMAQAREAERAAANKRIRQLERQALEDMDKAQKDVLARVAEAREQATVATGGQVLVRNRQLEADLTEQSSQLERLVARNIEVNRANMALKHEAAASEELCQALARRCHACQKAVQLLIKEKVEVTRRREEADAALASARGESKRLAEEVAIGQSEVQQQEGEALSMKAQLDAAQERVTLLEECCDESIRRLNRYIHTCQPEGTDMLNTVCSSLQLVLAGTAWQCADDERMPWLEGVLLPPVPPLTTKAVTAAGKRVQKTCTAASDGRRPMALPDTPDAITQYAELNKATQSLPPEHLHALDA